MELWFSECHAPDVKHSLRVNRHLYSKKSEYQQIDIFDTPEFGSWHWTATSCLPSGTNLFTMK